MSLLTFPCSPLMWMIYCQAWRQAKEEAISVLILNLVGAVLYTGTHNVSYVCFQLTTTLKRRVFVKTKQTVDISDNLFNYTKI